MIDNKAQVVDELRWHATHVRPRHEKSVAKQLETEGIEFFLPLYRTIHRWKDRRKIVHLPLFPGYLFTHLRRKDRLSVLRLYGVTRFVECCGAPAEVPEDDIRALQRGLAGDLSAEPHPYLRAGQRVRIHSGPLAGVEGVLLRKKGTCRIVLSFEAVCKAVALEVDVCDVEPLGRSIAVITTAFPSSGKHAYDGTVR